MNEFNNGCRSAVDLHIHSTASDGTDTPREILAHIMKKNILTFALTDHDTIDGFVQLKNQVNPPFHMISGVEFSCRQGENERFTKGWKCHVIGLGADIENPEFQALLVKARSLRLCKMHERIAALRTRHGIILSEDEVSGIMQHPCPGKPHLAALLTEKKLRENGIDAANGDNNESVQALYQSTFQKVISSILNQLQEQEEFLDPGETIRAIIAGGGVPVWAHPFGEYPKRFISEEEMRFRAGYLKELGLMGMECYYYVYDNQHMMALLKAADEYQLLVSGGSDYHGSTKQNQLGILGREEIMPQEEQLTVLTAITQQ